MEDKKSCSNVALSLGSHSCCLAYYYLAEESDLIEGTSKKDEGRITIVKFSSGDVPYVLKNVLRIIKSPVLTKSPHIILTGDRARQNIHSVQGTLNKSLILSDYSTSSVVGLRFLLNNIRDEAFLVDLNDGFDTLKYKFVNFPPSELNPSLFVTSNGRVFVFKVDSDGFERIGHSFYDSQVLLASARGLLDIQNFDELVGMAKLSKSYIKMVYSSYEFPNEMDLLKENLNMFESLNDSNNEDKNETAWDLLWVWFNNIGHVTSLYAAINNIKHVIFGEGCINDPLCSDLLEISIKYWSKNRLVPIFLRHEGCLSALGALVKSGNEAKFKDFSNSWNENLFLSSPLFTKICPDKTEFVLDSLGGQLTAFPWLVQQNYTPDIQNLYADETSRIYWLKCISVGVKKFCERISHPKVKSAVEKMGNEVQARLQHFEHSPFAYGNLTMRLIQDMIHQCKKENGLLGLYQEVKTKEHLRAVAEFPQKIKALDHLSDANRHADLILGVVAGNMFDWGAKESVELLSSPDFSFSKALDKLPSRPWLRDDVDLWVNRMKGPAHRCAVVFVDNYGFDLVLGVAPLVRELLKRGTKVILCSNRERVLNDVTHSELIRVMTELSSFCNIIDKSMRNGALSFVEMYKSSCCLDLSFINSEFHQMSDEVDLIILEGMGRAVHTNLSADFKVECLKLAVVKDHWFSATLGGSNFSPICSYTQ